jgi:hypothetical protein
MSSPGEFNSLAPRVRVMQIIGFALVMGVVVFMGIALFLRSTGNLNPPPEVPLVTYLGLALGSMQLVLFFVLPAIFVKSGRTRMSVTEDTLGNPASADSAEQLCGLYQTSLIIGDALLEGAAFYFLVAYLVEGQLLALIVAGFFLVILILQFPTRSRVERWIERQQELISQEQV